MARKPTDKQLFKMKNEWLGQFYEEVKPKDFYRAVFPEGSFEREGHPEDEKCNGVLTVIEGEKALTPQKWGVIFNYIFPKTLLIRLAVKRSKGQYII